MGIYGNTRVSQETEGGRELWGRPFILVSAGRTWQDKVAGLGLASLNNFGGLWGIGAGPTGLAPGQGTRIVA